MNGLALGAAGWVLFQILGKISRFFFSLIWTNLQGVEAYLLMY